VLRKKKILHLTRAVTPTSFGGLERAVRELVTAQRDFGLDTRIFEVPPDSLTTGECLIHENKWDRVAAVAGRFIENAMPFDVLHVHDWYGAAAADFWYRLGNRPIVVTMHLPARRGFTYRDTQKTSWRDKVLFEFRLLDVASKIIAPSPYIKDYLVEEYGTDDCKIAVIPQGVSPTFFTELQSDRDGDHPTVLYVGRVTSQKGVELLIRAFPYVLKVYNKTCLRIIGQGDALARCQALVSRLGLAPHVTFRTPLLDRDIIDEYQRASLLVMPSVFEPFGLVGLEAMASGCPVLSIRPTGASYLNDDELTPHLSPSRLGAAIGSRLSISIDAIKRNAIRQRARQFTWERTSKLVAELYETLL
jgi:glycosyltransferase involved in cell wall biosynthesis